MNHEYLTTAACVRCFFWHKLNSLRRLTPELDVLLKLTTELTGNISDNYSVTWPLRGYRTALPVAL